MYLFSQCICIFGTCVLPCLINIHHACVVADCRARLLSAGGGNSAKLVHLTQGTRAPLCCPRQPTLSLLFLSKGNRGF